MSAYRAAGRDASSPWRGRPVRCSGAVRANTLSRKGLAAAVRVRWIYRKVPRHRVHEPSSRARHPAVRAGAMQPDIPQTIKWDRDEARNILGVLESETRRVAALRPDVVFWPEAVTPLALLGTPWMEEWIRRDADDDGLVADVTEWMDHSRFLRLPEGQRTLYSNVLYYAALRRMAYVAEALGTPVSVERVEVTRVRVVRVD